MKIDGSNDCNRESLNNSAASQILIWWQNFANPQFRYFQLWLQFTTRRFQCFTKLSVAAMNLILLVWIAKLFGQTQGSCI